MKSLALLLVLIVSMAVSINAACNLLGVPCVLDNQCAHDTNGNNKCTSYCYFGGCSMACGPGGTPYNGSLCPLNHYTCASESFCDQSTDGSTHCVYITNQLQQGGSICMPESCY